MGKTMRLIRTYMYNSEKIPSKRLLMYDFTKGPLRGPLIHVKDNASNKTYMYKSGIIAFERDA